MKTTAYLKAIPKGLLLLTLAVVFVTPAITVWILAMAITAIHKFVIDKPLRWFCFGCFAIFEWCFEKLGFPVKNPVNPVRIPEI